MKPKIEAPQEKPIDLFKAIFEEGSSDEDSDSQEGDAEKEGNSNTGQKALAYSAMPALPRGQAREPEPEAIAKIIFRPQVLLSSMYASIWLQATESNLSERTQFFLCKYMPAIIAYSSKKPFFQSRESDFLILSDQISPTNEYIPYISIEFVMMHAG